jgi:hypothetical protein
VADQGQTESVLGLEPGQSCGRVQHRAKHFAIRQFAWFDGDRAGNLLKLVAARQIVLDDDELAIELNGGF